MNHPGPASPSGSGDIYASSRGSRGLLLPPARNIVLVAAGGMIGAALRVWFAVVMPSLPGRFPWTTFVENVLGAFLLGLSLVLLLERWRPTRQVHPFLCTGILGSFTTFSNFSIEWLSLAGSQRPLLAVVYPLVSMVAGLAAALLGVMLARHWPPFRRRQEITY